MAEPSSHIDWDKWGAPAVIFTVMAFVATWIRPALAALLHNLLRTDPARAVETGMAVWKSDMGRIQMKEFLKELLKDELAISQKALNIAEENKDVLTQVKFTQEALGLTVSSIEESVAQVPSLSEALDRISHSMEHYAEHMKTVSDFMSRSDERERMRDKYEQGTLQDRRHHQTDPHPHNRREDNS